MDVPIRQDALAAELGMSKIPVREALARLEQVGLLVSRTNRAYFVHPCPSTISTTSTACGVRLAAHIDQMRQELKRGFALAR
jgi:DNA-binding FadR family transcriptional regulator